MKSWIVLGGLLLSLWLLAPPFPSLFSGSVLLLATIFLRNKPILPWIYALLGLWLGLYPLITWEMHFDAYLNDTIVGALLLSLFCFHQKSPPSIPPNWEYNPSGWPGRLPIAFFAFVGWMISRYLACFQLGYIDHIWDPFFGDGTVNVITSNVSKSFPVSDAGLGAFAYSLEMILVFKGGQSRWRTEPWLVLLFGLLAVPLSLTSVILILLQPLVVGSWCTLCLITAFCMLLVVALSIDEVIASIQFLKTNEKPFWNLLLEGGESPHRKEDRQTPDISAPLKKVAKAACYGLSLPWNLALTILIGANLMALPWFTHISGNLADIDHIIGAFTIVVSMVSLAQIVRPLHYLNSLFGLTLLIASLFYGHFFIHFPLALLLILLSMPKIPRPNFKKLLKR